MITRTRPNPATHSGRAPTGSTGTPRHAAREVPNLQAMLGPAYAGITAPRRYPQAALGASYCGSPLIVAVHALDFAGYLAVRARALECLCTRSVPAHCVGASPTQLEVPLGHGGVPVRESKRQGLGPESSRPTFPAGLRNGR